MCNKTGDLLMNKCIECGQVYPDGVVRCVRCGISLDVFVGDNKVVRMLSDVSVVGRDRYSGGLGEFDRAVNGIVMGGSYLVGGNPGSGKSTLLLQVCEYSGKRVLYVSGEESDEQVKERADRLGLGVSNVQILIESDVGVIEGVIGDSDVEMVIIDSVQTLHVSGVSQAQMEIEGIARIQSKCKSNGITVFFIGHVTKDGTLAGRQTLKHLVDTILMLEDANGYKFLKAEKNRFGSLDVGVFKMTDKGLVDSTYKIDSDESEIGRAITVFKETSERLFPLEVDSLCRISMDTHIISKVPLPMVKSLWAVLDFYDEAIELGDYQLVFETSIKTDDKGIGLAILASMISSIYRIRFDGICFIGEVKLSGQIIRPDMYHTRLSEARKLGVTVISPNDMSHVRDLITYARTEKKSKSDNKISIQQLSF